MRMEWIEVTDWLPEERQKVLLHFWNGRVEVGSRFGDKWHANWNDYDVNLASHWMPIILPDED